MRRRARWGDNPLRCWLRTAKGLVRLLVWDDYRRCTYGGEPVNWIYRLRPDDPRPRGCRMVGQESTPSIRDWYAALPMGCWLRVES